jgi:catechol 2,3-dioxygenase-like lactoylglutathione lyase family enzyme
MINYVSIGTRDIPRARQFYGAALKPLGYTCLSSSDASLGYGKNGVAFWLLLSPRPLPSNTPSGLHFCFGAPTRKSVDAFYKAALASGGTDNGKPGLRTDYGEGGIMPRSSLIPTVTESRPIATSPIKGVFSIKDTKE